MKEGNIYTAKNAGNKNESIEKLQEKADKWDKITRTGVLDYIKDISDNIPLALVECSSLQQMIIECVNELDDVPENMCHINYATQRLVNIIHDVFYNRDAFEEIFT